MRFIVFLVLTAVALATSPAVAEEYSGDDWWGWSSADDKTGEFTGCAITRENSAEEWLMLILQRGAGAGSGTLIFNIKVASPDLRFVEGQSYYPVRIQVDGKGLGGEAEAMSDGTGVIIFLPDEDESVRAFGGGKELAVQTMQANLVFPLNGSGKALEWLRGCAKSGLAGITQNREQSGGSPPSAGPEKITDEAMRWILDKAGLTGYTMAPPEKSGTAEHAWNWGGMGGIQFYGPKAGENFDTVFANAAEYFPGKCTTATNIRREIARFPNGIANGRLGYDCRDEDSVTRYSIVMVNDGGRVIVFMLYGFDAAAIDGADRRIFAVLEKIYK